MVDLGVMVSCDTILDMAIKEKVQVIGALCVFLRFLECVFMSVM